MNHDRHYHSAAEREALEARFALRVTGRLAEHAQSSRHDVTERLRFAREQALARARASRPALVPATATAAAGVVIGQRGGAAVLGGAPGEGGLWFKLASLIPILALLFGFMMIQQWHQHEQIAAAADVDAELLSDDLPPAAYQDPGFAEFLKTSAPTSE